MVTPGSVQRYNTNLSDGSEEFMYKDLVDQMDIVSQFFS